MTEQDPGKARQELEKKQITALRSGNRVAVLDTLASVRSLGSVTLLPELFDLLLDQEDEEISREISSVLCDLKKQEAAPVLAAAIDNPEYGPISAQLASACWQSGLSFGDHTDTFARLAVKGDFQAALEAFTVLEEAIGEVSREKRSKLSEQIRRQIPGMDEQKILLLRELVRVIDTY